MGSNVWIKSGTVRNGFSDLSATGGANGTTSNATGAWLYKDSPEATFQADVIGTGAVAATITIQFSNDVNPLTGVGNPLATAAGVITLTGTSPQSDGFTTTSAPWKWWRAVVSGISGTNATVQVYHGV